MGSMVDPLLREMRWKPCGLPPTSATVTSPHWERFVQCYATVMLESFSLGWGAGLQLQIL